MANVTIFTTPTCTYCKKAKAYMNENNIEYVEKDVTKDAEARMELMQKGYRGVPIIRIDGEDIVGFDQQRIQELLNK